MAIISRPVNYDDNGVPCEGYFAFDTDWQSPRPGILISPTWAGRDDFAKTKAHRLAELGYAAFALDIYGAARIGQSQEECMQLMSGLASDRPRLQGRMIAALDALNGLPEVDESRTAAMGFCFGGLCVLDLARTGADIRGVISFHGIFNPPENTGDTPIKARVLVLHGFEDPMATPEQAVALGHELTAKGADWQIHLYGNTMHAFTNPMANEPHDGKLFNPLANRRSWETLQSFLAEVLQ